MRHHDNTHEGSPTGKLFACTYLDCTKRFTRRDDLRGHIRDVHLVDSDGHQEAEQPEVQGSPSPVVDGQNEEDRPYRCLFADCGRSFKWAHNLRRHVKTHRPEGAPLERPFACTYLGCTTRFTRRDGLYKHIREVHHGDAGVGLLDMSPTQDDGTAFGRFRLPPRTS